MRFSSITNESEVNSPKKQPKTAAKSTSTSSRGVTLSRKNNGSNRETSYLNLVAKVKELGLHNTSDLSKSKLIASSSSDVTDVGLNAIISIRRNRTLKSAAAASMMASPFGGSVTNLASTFSPNQRPKMMMQPGVLTKATSLECLTPYGSARATRRSMTSSPLVAGAVGGSVQAGSGVSSLNYAVTPPTLRSPATVARSRHDVYASKPDSVTSSSNVDSGTVHSPRRKRPTTTVTSSTSVTSHEACLNASVTSPDSPSASPAAVTSSSTHSRVSDALNRFVRSPLLTARSSFVSSSPKTTK